MMHFLLYIAFIKSDLTWFYEYRNDRFIDQCLRYICAIDYLSIN